MKDTVNLTLNDLDPKKAAQILAMLSKKAAATSTDDDDDEDEEEETTPRKTGKKPAQRAASNDDDDDTEDDDDDTDDDDESNDGPTMAEVLAAFKTFTKKNKGNKKPAIAILKKFDVKSPSELEEEDFGKVMKLLTK